MSIYDSLDEYTEIGISFGRTIRIAKMTLGKTLDFDALYGYLKVLQTVEKSKIKKVWDIRDTEKEQRRVIRLGAEILLGTTKILFMTSGDRKKVFDAGVEMVKLKKTEPGDKGKENNPDWLDDLYALFAAQGYGKNDVLGMYPSEIASKIKAFGKRDLMRLADQAIAHNSPQTIMDRLEKEFGSSGNGKVKSEKLSKAEREKLEAKYCQGNYGARK